MKQIKHSPASALDLTNLLSLRGLLSLITAGLAVGGAPLVSAAGDTSPSPLANSHDAFSAKFAASKNAIDAWRVFTGSDGTSHLEKVQFDASLVPFFGADKGLFKVGPVEVKKDSKVYLPAQPARVLLYSAPGNVELPEHPSPGSEMFLILRGTSTLLLRDGTEHEFGPGDIIILEDQTGPGHGTRIGPNGFTAINFSFDASSPIGAHVTRR